MLPLDVLSVLEDCENLMLLTLFCLVSAGKCFVDKLAHSYMLSLFWLLFWGPRNLSSSVFESCVESVSE